MRQEVSPFIVIRRATSHIVFASAVAMTGACGEAPDGDESPVESQSSPLAATVACYAVTGAIQKYVDSHYHLVYTVGSNYASIKCPIPVSSTTVFANFLQIQYIDSNGGGINCQLHSKKNGVDVYSKTLTSTRNTNPFTIRFSDGYVATMYHTTEPATLVFSKGAGLELQCVLAPGALLSDYTVTY